MAMKAKDNDSERANLALPLNINHWIIHAYDLVFLIFQYENVNWCLMLGL